MAVLEIPETHSPAGDALALLRAGVDAVQAVGLSTLDGEDLESFAVGLLRESQRLSAAVSTAVVGCDNAGLAPRRGSIASTTAYLASHTHGPTAAIAPSRTLGLWLVDLPELAAAWAAGSITEAHLRELKGVDNPRTHLLLIRDQHLHVGAAQTLEFKYWLDHLAYWLLHADPDGAPPRDRNTSFGLRFQKDRYGNIELAGTLDPLSGEALLMMVEHEAKALRKAEQQAQLAPRDQSTSRQLHLLALLRLCKRGFQREDGGWPLPLINIVMSETVAEDLISRVTNSDDHDPFELPLDYHDIDARCETIRGTPLDPRRTWPALMVGRLRRQVINANNRTINLGRDVRLFTAVQKQALLVEARGHCPTPGCDSPFAWLVADHIHPASKGGPTDLENGQTPCEPCNLRKADRTDLE